MPDRRGVGLRPTIEREALYRRVLELRKDGMSYNQIISKIQEERGAKLSKSQVSDWTTAKHQPFGYVRAFSPDSCPELAYVIGVMLGDGSMSTNRNHMHMIKLRVIDREFAEEFARCLSILLHRSPPRVKWNEKTHAWHTQVSSLLLQAFLKQDLPQLKPTIEHCENCVSAFIRGFFDSEGWVYRRRLGVVNTNTIRLEYVRMLLESKFQIHATGPRLKSKGGRKVMIKGKIYNANKDCFELLVASASIPSYQSRVGFSIFRKRDRLANAVRELTRKR